MVYALVFILGFYFGVATMCLFQINRGGKNGIRYKE